MWDCDVIQLETLECNTLWHHAWGYCLLLCPFKDSWLLCVPPGLVQSNFPFCPQLYFCDFFGAFAKLRKATVSFVVSVCGVEQIGCHWLIFAKFYTHFVEPSPSWEANWFSASQEIPQVLWNPKVHYRTHKCPPRNFVLAPYIKICREYCGFGKIGRKYQAVFMKA